MGGCLLGFWVKRRLRRDGDAWVVSGKLSFGSMTSSSAALARAGSTSDLQDMLVENRSVSTRQLRVNQHNQQ